jgi:hypothetical protein
MEFPGLKEFYLGQLFWASDYGVVEILQIRWLMNIQIIRKKNTTKNSN